jgi:hypothetical protein
MVILARCEMPRMWRAARALTSCGYPAFGGASSPGEIAKDLNKINDLKSYRFIQWNLQFPADNAWTPSLAENGVLNSTRARLYP